jgi:hypothetical protein
MSGPCLTLGQLLTLVAGLLNHPRWCLAFWIAVGGNPFDSDAKTLVGLPRNETKA